MTIYGNVREIRALAAAGRVCSKQQNKKRTGFFATVEDTLPFFVTIAVSQLNDDFQVRVLCF